MSKTTKIFSVVCVIIFAGLLCFALCGCTEKPEDYTLEEHIARITPRIEKTYINAETRRKEFDFITDYKVYPLYDNGDKLQNFLIEFEPYGFAFIDMQETSMFFGMYFKCEMYVTSTWSRYRKCIDGVEPEPYEGKQWQKPNNSYTGNYRYETDDNSEVIKYNHSPYAVAGVLDKKMYLLNLYHEYVPAIKRDDKYFNLVSMDEFVCEGDKMHYKESDVSKLPPRLPLSFPIKQTL